MPPSSNSLERLMKSLLCGVKTGPKLGYFFFHEDGRRGSVLCPEKTEDVTVPFVETFEGATWGIEYADGGCPPDVGVLSQFPPPASIQCTNLGPIVYTLQVSSVVQILSFQVNGFNVAAPAPPLGSFGTNFSGSFDFGLGGFFGPVTVDVLVDKGGGSCPQLISWQFNGTICAS